MNLLQLATRDLLRMHSSWMEGDKIAMAHGLATMLRILITFGSTILEDANCQRLRGLLAGLRFKNSPRRSVWITEDQATRVRDAATKYDFHAIALAQAFQFDCALRQKDVLGEWVPLSDDAFSTLFSLDGQYKWVRGILREEVSTDMILTHTTSKRGQRLSFPLESCPAVLEEWFSAPPSGPLIIDPDTDLPYQAWKFRRLWRLLATVAKVPPEVWNMDTRAGRITDVIAKGATLEQARHLAGHQQQSTTAGYARGSQNNIAAALKAGKDKP